MSENQKKIWITGASSGIGKAVAEKFAKEGWKVAVSARRKELLDELAKNENISSFPLDVTDRSQINNTFKNILNELGELDICLFSSGTYEPKDEQNIDPDKIKNVIKILDTHDRIGGRKELLLKHGIESNFFHLYRKDQQELLLHIRLPYLL